MSKPGTKPRTGAATRVFEAIYEDRVLRPLQDPGLPEHHRFSVQVQELGATDAAAEIAAWRKVYEGLSDTEIDVVESIALDRSRFSRRQPE